jgi:hypothetical protein
MAGAGPVRPDLAFAARQVVHQEGAHDGGNVAEDDQEREPVREMLAPRGERQSDDGGEQQRFVRQRIEDRAEAAALVEAPRDIAVQHIAERRESDGENGAPAVALVRRAIGHALPVIDRKPDEDRDEQDAEYGDLGGERHGQIALHPWQRGWLDTRQ